MKLNKAPVRVIFLLDLVLIVLIVAIGVQYALNGKFRVGGVEPAASADVTVTEPAPAPEYSTERSARLSLSDSIDLETNVGGSGDERLTDVIAVGDRVYVFGNTESNDYDATSGNGAFVSVLGADLNTVAFYRPSDRKIAGVTLAEGGFLLALGDSGGVSLALMNYDGEVTATAPATDGEFAALRLTDEGYALITGVTHSPLSKKKLLLRAYDFSLGLTLERMISSPYSLDFVDVFKTGDTYTVFFNATSDLSRHAGTAVCRLFQPGIKRKKGTAAFAGSSPFGRGAIFAEAAVPAASLAGCGTICATCFCGAGIVPDDFPQGRILNVEKFGRYSLPMIAIFPPSGYNKR